MTETSCLVCTENSVEAVIDLGRTVPANQFMTQAELETSDETWHPLRLGICTTCGHVQLLDKVPPADLFQNYRYVSSASSTLTEHLHSLATTIAKRVGLSKDSLVLDVGCNDGTLLEGFSKAGVERRVGVDPAVNLAPRSRTTQSEIVIGYFDEVLAQRIVGEFGRADAITMTNTLPHVPDLHGLMRAIDLVLQPTGVAVVEAHYLGDLVRSCAFDTIYHEHVSYWSLTPLRRLLAEHGFEVFDVERLPIHHGQLRAWIGRSGHHSRSDSVSRLTEEEAESHLHSRDTYEALVPRIERIRSDLIALIEATRTRGGTVVGYGAPAKGSTLLTYFGLGPEHVAYIADRSPLKQNRLTPGSHIPIVSPDRILSEIPELVILLAWNFADEIAEQLRPYLEAGGRIVTPIPELRQLEIPE